MRSRLILAVTTLTMLGGCIHRIDTDDKAQFGRARTLMISAQTEPVIATDEAPQSSGALGARAVSAYANATPPPPQTINLNVSTTSD